MCEVGAFRRGLDDASISLKDILRKPLGESVCCAAVKNYEGMWDFGGAFHGTAFPRGDPETFHVSRERDIDVVIAPFDAQKHGEGKVHVIIGIMHIVCRHKAPSILQRKKAVRALRDYLDGLAAPEGDAPVVRIMLGDNNQQLQEALQCATDNESVWTVVATTVNLGGDNIAVCGAVARCAPIAVGASFQNRGMRNDTHDALAVEITRTVLLSLRMGKNRNAAWENPKTQTPRSQCLRCGVRC